MVAVKQILCQGVEAMKDLIKYIVRALVDHPEQIEISEITGKQVTILELKVALGLCFFLRFIGISF